MDSLLRAGDAADLQHGTRALGSSRAGPSKKSSGSKNTKEKDSETAKEEAPADKVVQSIVNTTSLPTKQLARFSAPRPEYKLDKKNKWTPAAFQRKIENEKRWKEDAKVAVKDAEILKTEDRGRMVTENELEKTWRMTQDEIVKNVGEEVARYRKEWTLDGGSYRARYSRNGRHMAIVGKRGHVASFDWQTGNMHCELQLRETCRDITYLNDHSHIAVAQKRHVYIYDQQGIELHRLKEHMDPTRLDYLPYHWLLVTVGNPGILRYIDTSMGKVVATHRTKLGACQAMAQNPHNAVIYLGHQNGTVTLWTPNLPEPAVRLLAHLGGVTSLSVDPSNSGRYLATAGVDGKVKVWDCRNWKGCLREWDQRGDGHAEVEWSQRGYLSVASGGSVNVYTPPTIIQEHRGRPPLYLYHPIPQRPLASIRFCPYTDMLTIGHAGGVSSIIVPGAGEPTFDTAELDPFENKRRRREREVHNLLDKIQPELIALDPDFVGSLADSEQKDEFTEAEHVPYYKLPRQDKIRRSGYVDAEADAEAPGTIADTVKPKDTPDEDMEVGYSASDSDASEYDAESDPEENSPWTGVKRRKKSALKVYQSKVGKNVIDPTTARIRAQMQLRRREIEVANAKERQAARKPSALDRFRRPIAS